MFKKKIVNLPTHIAFIMDGNRRWAQKHHMEKMLGHKKGCDVLKEIVREIQTYKEIKYVSFFGFSTENWNRSDAEKKYLFDLLYDLATEILSEFDKNDAKFVVSGDISKFPKKLENQLIKVIDKTKNNTGVIINLCLNYGGRDDIVHAAKLLAESGEDFNIENFKKNLYSYPLQDIDLLVRTSGEIRVSNFMLFQLAYSELYFAKTFWPGFNKRQLRKALISFSKRNRRFGGK